MEGNINLLSPSLSSLSPSLPLSLPLPLSQVCNGSFCVVLNAARCECNETDEVCDVCCVVDGRCQSTIRIAEMNGSMADLLPGRMGQRLPVGTPCNNFIGYCDTLHNCFQVDSEGLWEEGFCGSQAYGL